jgi:hypothetical protein
MQLPSKTLAGRTVAFGGTAVSLVIPRDASEAQESIVRSGVAAFEDTVDRVQLLLSIERISQI